MVSINDLKFNDICKYKFGILLKIIFTCFLVVGFNLYSYSSPPLHHGDTVIELRSSDKYLEYIDKPDFDYSREETQAPLNFIQRILYWFFKTFDAKPVKYIIYVILTGILIFVIYKIIGYRYSGFRYNSQNIKRPEFKIFEENIHDIDFVSEIKSALKNKNYRLVIRYKYLYVLKLFAEKEIIIVQPFKTNIDYLREIKQRGFGNDFNMLTYIYEHAWYGNFAISESTYNSFNATYNMIEKTINENK